jgi:hypothetical protein
MTSTKKVPSNVIRVPVVPGKLTPLELPSDTQAFRAIGAPLVDAFFLLNASSSSDQLQGIPVWAESLTLTNGVPVWLDARNMPTGGSGNVTLSIECYSFANVAHVAPGAAFDSVTVTQTRNERNGVLPVQTGAPGAGRLVIASKNDNSLHTRFFTNDQRRSGTLYFAGEVLVTGCSSAPLVALTCDALAPAGTDVVLSFLTMSANGGTAGGFFANLNDGWTGGQRRVVPLSPCRLEVVSTDAVNAGVVHWRVGFLSR